MTAKDATILTLISQQPQTPYFDRLVAMLDDPALAARAERLRDHGQ